MTKKLDNGVPENAIPVVALTKQGTFVNKYTSYRDCERYLNLPLCTIDKFFKGAVNHVRNYIFVKEENYTKNMLITYDSIVRKRKFLKSKL